MKYKPLFSCLADRFGSKSIKLTLKRMIVSNIAPRIFYKLIFYSFSYKDGKSLQEFGAN